MTFAGLKESFVFIRRNAQGSVFSEPKLATTKLSDDVRAEWESKKLSATDWATEFQAIDGTNEVLTSTEDIQVESDFLVESTLVRTLAKRKKDSFAGEEYEGSIVYWPNSKYQRTLPEKPQELQDLINAGVGKGVLTTTVSNIETHIRGMSVALEDTVSIHHDRLLFLE